jgi:gamma-glutamylcyclotransferase (GGCT)/AIG2-like uncharacterized protein YtfP
VGDAQRLGRELLFVYGTLRRGGAAHALLEGLADFVAVGTCEGCLYLVADYPGVVLCNDARDRVSGEIHALREPATALPILDEYEGVRPQSTEPAEYVRRRRNVQLATGEGREAWIYLYNRPTDGLTRIASGDFAARKRG